MKKFLALSASAVLAVSMFAFAACSNNNNGVIEGNYKEPTADELQTAVENVDEEKVFEGLKGLEFDAKFTASTNLMGSDMSASLTLNYKLELGENLKGSGSASVKTTGENAMDIGATVYMDSDWVYASVSGYAEQDMKIKVNYGDMLEDVIGGILAIDADDEDIPTDDEDYPADEGGSWVEPSESLSLTEILEMLTEYDITVGLDDTNGLKLRLSASEDTFWLLVSDSEFIAYKDLVTFNKFVFDVYFALDSEGAFSQASLNVDIDAVMEGTESTLKANGYITVKAYNGNVTLPNGIESDSSYMDMSALLGGSGIPNLPF